jgi:hypothetical protein
MSKLQGRNLVGLFVALTLAAGSASAPTGTARPARAPRAKGVRAGSQPAGTDEPRHEPGGHRVQDEAIEAGLSISPMRDYDHAERRRRLLCPGPVLTVGPNDPAAKTSFSSSTWA